MVIIASTRFNEKTLLENNEYKKKKKMDGIIYGVNIKINGKYPYDTLMMIVEMNNDKNEINGIGIIRNNIVTDKKYSIYTDNNYNQYIYEGKYWIGRDKLIQYDNNIIISLELMVFKGKSHLKRQSGITAITNKLFTKWNFNENGMKESLKEIFIREFLGDIF